MTDDRTVLVVCGSRRTPSRSRALARSAAAIADDAGLTVETLDLRDACMELFDDRPIDEYDDVTVDAISRFLEAERYLVVSPIYFGGISGALKNLIDHVPYEPFRASPRVAGLLATGRDNRHQLVLDTQLRSTLVYLGVDVATTSVFATEAEFDAFTLASPAIERRIETVVDEIVALADG